MTFSIVIRNIKSRIFRSIGYQEPHRFNNLSLEIVLLCFLATGCHQEKSQVFNQLSADRTGIDFENTIEEDEVHNVRTFMNIYTGAGVAAGDINNDGLTDLYFSGNMVSGRLYLNQGDLRFEDITGPAGLENDRWGTGAAMVDINQDGWMDIYVNVSGSAPLDERANLLFINNRDGTFTESAKEYGIADTRQVMHASFFDCDKDGDLDLFLIINPAAYEQQVNTIQSRKVNGESISTDVLYRNNGDGTFTDVSKEAGILVEGYSLGVAISDINNDDWPDIYISNDFVGNDILYINNGDGTFTNRITDFVKHTSYAGMGNDVADINNDGLVDILVLDMRPEDNKRQKLIISSTSYDRFQLMLQKGYQPQYSRNTLQLNRGGGRFSEIGFLSGISSTDWSWSALLADYDNDGDRDLFVSNGFLRDLGNLDYIHYQNIYNTSMGDAGAKTKDKLEAIKSLEGADLQNYLYENNGDTTFTKQSTEWGIRERGFSNGAVYADLDNDGDLELIINNINGPAHLYENQSDRFPDRHYLRILLQGSATNRNGIGAKIHLKNNSQVQLYENFPFRGYESSVDPVIHFGLGAETSIDSLEVTWPDGRYQLLRDVPADQLLTLHYAEAKELPTAAAQPLPPPLFRAISGTRGLDYRHRENEYVDFKAQPILPHMHSRGGPGIAVGDVDGDGLEDFFVGGAAGYPGRLFVQQPDGSFESSGFEDDRSSEDMGVLFFDADGDSDLDLYVVSGGSAHPKGSSHYQDRLYLNDGQGGFQQLTGVLPPVTSSGASVVAADYDRDGDLDLFVAGRIVPGEYPLPARSYLLRNDTPPGVPERVAFTDVTEAIAPGLARAGLVTSALWTDYDNDGHLDLIVAGEFMPLRFFHNQKGHFVDASGQTGLTHINGWWNSLVGGDFDGDGDIDYLAGNLGRNSRFRATPEEPLCIYAYDYDKNGRLDPVMCYYIQGENYLAHTRDDIISQINAMRVRFRTYEDYANTTFEKSFLPAELEAAHFVRSDRFESSYLENLGNGKFTIKALPMEAQLSPVYGMLTGDYDQDGHQDVLLVGNSYATEVGTGRYDASIGLYLRGDGQGNLRPVRESGFLVDTDAKGLASLSLKDGSTLILATSNADSLNAFIRTESPSTVFRAAPRDAFAVITMKNGTRYRQEFHYGSTYLSQSSRTVRITPDMAQLTVTDYRGASRNVPFNETEVK